MPSETWCDISDALTVGELREVLATYDQDLPVHLFGHGLSVCGAISTSLYPSALCISNVGGERQAVRKSDIWAFIVREGAR